jgi:hypothetical protein
MAVSRISKQSIQAGFPKQQTIWDQSSSVAGMDALGSITVSTSYTSGFTFSNIPQTYTHLQIRGNVRDTRATAWSTVFARYGYNNGTIDSSNSYAFNYTYGYNTTVGDGGGSSQTTMYFPDGTAGAQAPANTYGFFIVDIYDYANTTKPKIAKAIGAIDTNSTAGAIELVSNFWNKTNAITDVYLYPPSGSWVVGSVISLYGIK